MRSFEDSKELSAGIQSHSSRSPDAQRSQASGALLYVRFTCRLYLDRLHARRRHMTRSVRSLHPLFVVIAGDQYNVEIGNIQRNDHCIGHATSLASGPLSG